MKFPESTSIAANCFDLVQMDIRGPFSIQSYTGHSYFLTIVDDHSCCTWLYMMKNKSETRVHMQAFYEMILT